MGRGRRLGTEQVQKLLIALAFSLFVSACTLPAGRDIRAYNVCIARHAQEAVVCEGPRQAYEVDASDIPARATANRPAAGYISAVGSAVPPAPRPVPLHPSPMPVTAGPNGEKTPSVVPGSRSPVYD